MGNCFGCRDKSPAPAKGTGKSPPSLPISTGSSGTSGGSSGTSASAGGASSGSEDFRRWPGAGVGVGGRVLDAPRLRVFTLAELRAVTRGFKPEMVLGEGGFGRVYKGWADERSLNPAKSSAGVVVAVKKLNSESVQGLQEWQVVGGELSGQAAAPEPGEAAGVLRRGPGAAPRLRVHAQGQPREPPLPAGRRLRAAAVGHAAQDRRRRRAGPRLPALAGDADHLPGLQGLQHPPRRRLQPQALGLWARQERPRGGPLPRHHAGHRHLRLRGARVRRHGTPLRQERRLRLRRRPPRAAHGAPRARHQPAQPPGEPRGVGAPVHRRWEEAHQPHGPAPGGAVPAQGRAPGCQARAPLPLRRPQVQACHGRRAGQAGGDRVHGGVERRAAAQACNGGGGATVAVPWILQALTVST